MICMAVASQKGGVGKTTLALNLAYSLARRGHRTLLVDADPVGAIGLSLAGSVKDRPGLAEWLGDRDALERHVIRTRLPQLALLTAGRAVFDAGEAELTPGADAAALQDLCARARSAFDLVLIDTPAGIGGATAAVLRVADHVVVPLQTEPLALRALPHTLRAINALRAAGARARLSAVVLTMAQARDATSEAVAREALAVLPADLALATRVPRDPSIAQASVKGVPVGLLQRSPPPAAIVFDQIAAELEPRIGLRDEEEQNESLDLLV